MTPRLFIDAPLKAGGIVSLSQEQAHYLKNVLRRNVGEAVHVFNGRDGEFAADIVALKKKDASAAIKTKTREQKPEANLTLLFAPIKRGPLETIIQKATEIGASQLKPVITERTIASKLNIGRLQAIATEAAEQCGRLTVPSVDEPIKFTSALDNWPDDLRLMFCDESGDDASQQWGGREGRAVPALEALKAINSKTENWAILTGPEGGFSQAEREMLTQKEFVTPVTLGPRILRADTAAIAALVLWQAALGDWRAPESG